MVGHNLQFEAEVPAGLVPSPVRIFVAQQAHPSMADGLAEGYWLAIHQVNVVVQGQARLLDEPADQGSDFVQTCEPLRIAG